MRARPRCKGGAFTLIELLVVMGLIAILIGGLAVVLRNRGAQGTALQIAQSQLAALLGTARAQAGLRQTPARLLVYASPPPAGDASKYLRALQVVVEEPAASGRWQPVGEPLYLPETIYVVPHNSVATSHRAAGVNWPDGDFAPVSTFSGPQDFSLNGVEFGRAYFIEFTPEGRFMTTLGNQSVAKIVLSTADSTANSVPRFNNPEAVRGLVLRAGGALSFVSDASGF